MERAHGDINVPWATIVVLTSKFTPALAKNGSKFATWKVSDLANTEVSHQIESLNVFQLLVQLKLVVFEKSLNVHWKLEEGQLMVLSNTEARVEKVVLRLTTSHGLNDDGFILGRARQQTHSLVGSR